MNELQTPEQRAEATTPFVHELSKLAPKAQSAGFGLLGIDPNTLELLDFRMDCLARLEALQADPLAIEERMEVIAELDAAELEIRKLCGSDVARIDNFAAVRKLCEAMEAHEKDERDRRNRKAKRWAAIKKFLDNIAMEALTLANATRFDSPTTTIRMQRDGQGSVTVTDAQSVQDRFINVDVRFRMDKWKQIRTELPDLLPEHFQVLEQTFALSDIGKVIKVATAADLAIDALARKEGWKDQQIADAKKQVERVRGAKLTHGKHLRVE